MVSFDNIFLCARASASYAGSLKRDKFLVASLGETV